jgi:hypothetical protein
MNPAIVKKRIIAEILARYGLVTDNQSSLPVFILCDKCYWCATYLDKTRGPIYNKCPHCSARIELSSFPIMSNESFIFDYNERRGVELQFGSR